MNIVSQAEASKSHRKYNKSKITIHPLILNLVMLSLSAKSHGGTEANRLYLMANVKFKEAARAGTYSAYTYYRFVVIPTFFKTSFRWGEMLYSMAMLKIYKLTAKDILKKAIGHLEKVIQQSFSDFIL